MALGRIDKRIISWASPFLGVPLSLDTPVAVVVAALLLLGLGYAFFSTPNTSVIMGCLPRRYLGVASA